MAKACNSIGAKKGRRTACDISLSSQLGLFSKCHAHTPHHPHSVFLSHPPATSPRPPLTALAMLLLQAGLGTLGCTRRPFLLVHFAGGGRNYLPFFSYFHTFCRCIQPAGSFVPSQLDATILRCTRFGFTSRPRSINRFRTSDEKMSLATKCRNPLV